MKLQKKGFLSLVLVSFLLVLPSAEVAAYDINNCIKSIQSSTRTLLLSKLSRYFLPIVVLTSIGTLFALKWYKNHGMRKSNPVDQGSEKESDSEEIGGGEGGQRMKKFVEQLIQYSGNGENNGVPVGQQFDRMYLASGCIKYDNGLIQGVAYTPFKNVVVQQLAVLNQSEEKQIGGRLIPVGGGNASCGYHAIKNSLMLLIKGNSIEKSINNTSIARVFFGMSNDQVVDIGSWRAEVRDHRDNNDDGEWLSEREIKYLIEDIDAFNVGYSIIEDVDVLEFLWGEVKKVKNVIRQNLSSKYVFFISTGGQSQAADGKLTGRNGHWFTMVLDQEAGNRIYNILDSSNTVRVHNDEWVKKVLNAFEDKKGISDSLVLSHEELNIMKGGIERLLDSKDEDSSNEEINMKLLELKNRYQGWSGTSLSGELQKRISERLAA